MESSEWLTSRPSRLQSAPGRAARGALGAVIATALALAAFVAIGVCPWGTVTGLEGVGLCGALGAGAGAVLSGPGSRLARILGGGIGGIVAGYFALASGEMLPLGTARWALTAGAYAALFALPLASFVGGLIALLNPESRSSG
jgi:hypothetical protein